MLIQFINFVKGIDEVILASKWSIRFLHHLLVHMDVTQVDVVAFDVVHPFQTWVLLVPPTHDLIQM